MSLSFRDAPSFWRETLAVTVGAVAVGALAPVVIGGVPLEVAAGSAALLGGSIGAALTRHRPSSKLLRLWIGAAGGLLAALGSAALATRFGLGQTGAVIGGALGALTMGSLLGSDEDTRGHGVAHGVGLAAAAATGVAGVSALGHIAAFTTSHGTAAPVAGATMAGALALWVTAAAGLRRLQHARDPVLVRADAVLEGLADPARASVHDALAAYGEILQALTRDGVSPELADDARDNARRLMEALLETAHTWGQIQRDIASPRLRALDDKLLSLQQRTEETTDAVTLGHLARAGQALRAQKAAVDGLKVGLVRAEAALDAHMALLERLRLAVAQHRISDRERLAVELSAVADQVTLLSDDLESLSAAIAEAEAFSDRRLLADVERAGRRALDALTEGAREGEAVAAVVPREAEQPVKRS